LVALALVCIPTEDGWERAKTFQIHPEQSTTALVVHHPKASYYAV